MTYTPRSGPESAKTVSVVDQHVSTSWGSTTMEIASGPKKGSNSPRNRSDLAKTVSVDDGHINAPRGSTIVEIALGPQNVE